jgi:hypothetical protein
MWDGYIWKITSNIEKCIPISLKSTIIHMTKKKNEYKVEDSQASRFFGLAQAQGQVNMVVVKKPLVS